MASAPLCDSPLLGLPLPLVILALPSAVRPLPAVPVAVAAAPHLPRGDERCSALRADLVPGAHRRLHLLPLFGRLVVLELVHVLAAAIEEPAVIVGVCCDRLWGVRKWWLKSCHALLNCMPHFVE